MDTEINLIRIPRPLGTTSLNSQNKKKALIRSILLSYIHSNYTICKVSYSLEQVAQMLGIPYALCLKHYLKIQSQLGAIYANPKTANRMHAAGILRLELQSSMDRGLIHQQLAMVLDTQGNGWKPFVSQEVTKLLNTLIASNKQHLEVVKMLQNGTQNHSFIGTQIIQNGTQNDAQIGTKNTQYLTLSQAALLVQNTTSDDQVGTSNLALALPQKGTSNPYANPDNPTLSYFEDLKDLPEIDARKQGTTKRKANRTEEIESILPHDLED